MDAKVHFFYKRDKISPHSKAVASFKKFLLFDACKQFFLSYVYTFNCLPISPTYRAEIPPVRLDLPYQPVSTVQVEEKLCVKIIQ